MKKNIILWIAAIVITLTSAYYQRVTGPTYPLTGKTAIDDKVITYKFDRSHGGETDHIVRINTDDESIGGIVAWKRYKTNDEWTQVEMVYKDGFLSAPLPNQPPAGKLEYKVYLLKNGREYIPGEGKPVVIRFKGDVPAWILIPHVILIFLAMVYSTRTGLEAITKGEKQKKLTLYTFALLVGGGMIFGPLTQLYAFGALWTGFPFGYDLTDNKTLIAFIGWAVAIYSVYKLKKSRIWIIAASIIMLIIFLIPHSLLGSELDYNELDREKQKIEQSAE